MRVKLLPLILSLIWGASFILLQGCSGEANRYLANKQEFLSCQGHPQSYVDGYVDGCSTGKRLAGERGFDYKRDEIRADKDALYARGWHDGQLYCRNESLIESQKGCGKDSSGREYAIFDAARNRRVEEESRAAKEEMQAIWEQLKK